MAIFEKSRNYSKAMDEVSNMKDLMMSLELNFKESKYHLNNVLNPKEDFWVIHNNDPITVDIIEEHT